VVLEFVENDDQLLPARAKKGTKNSDVGRCDEEIWVDVVFHESFFVTWGYKFGRKVGDKLLQVATNLLTTFGCNLLSSSLGKKLV
jgi:hypothetical protein